MVDYKKLTEDFLEYELDIVDFFVDGDYETGTAPTIDALHEMLMYEIPTQYPDNEELWEAEEDRHRIEIYEVLEGHKDEIIKGRIIKLALDVIWNDPEIKEFYNGNMWDIYEILDYMDTTEIDNIRKNLLNGREVKEC